MSEFKRRGIRPIRPERHLNEATSVAKIHKEQAAEVTTAVHPTCEMHPRIGIRPS
jgi:hypothetical protein